MALKWKELELVLAEARKSLEGSILQKIHQTGEIAKGESFIFQGYQSEGGAWRLWASLLPEQTFVCLLPVQEKMDSAAEPLHFVMILRKHLIGKSILKIEQLGSDRLFMIHFSDSLSLLFELIPRRANLILLENWNSESRCGRCLGSHRQVTLQTGGQYELPPPPGALKEDVRDWVKGAKNKNLAVAAFYKDALSNLEFSNLKRKWQQAVKQQEKKIHAVRMQAEKDIKDAKEAELYQQKGKILTANLYKLGPKKFPNEKKIILDEIEITLDLQKSFADNAENHFKKSKKFTRAVGELERRYQELNNKENTLKQLMQKIEATKASSELEKLREALEEENVQTGSQEVGKKSSEAKPFLVLESTEGFLIYCGRNQEENRRVTFQEAKGNDVWMHLRGVPGAHVVIKSQKNKTVPLQTLLEAAQATLYYSKIRKGKRAEVDYTFKKYVRAIKGTLAEVTYTENKTLYVESDAEVLKKIIRE